MQKTIIYCVEGTCPLMTWIVAVGATCRPAGLGGSCFFKNFMDGTFFSAFPLGLSNTS